jgi:tetratricopeptide (TPR) repeat protein
MRARVLISALLVGATLLAFFEVREHSFVDYDDITLIVRNENLRSASPGEAFRVAARSSSIGNWTPLTLLSLQANFALHGLEPAGYLITNVALHAASAVILFLALARLTGGIWASAFVAGAFALHPLHVESVAWAALRKDTLSALFWMLTLLAYARYTERLGPGRYAWVAVFLTLGLLAKPVVVTLPCVLLLLDYWPLGRLRRRAERRRALLEKLPLLVPVAIVSAVTIVLQQDSGALQGQTKLPFELRLWNALDSYAVYLGKSFWPTGLAIFYPHPVNALPGARVTLAGLLLAGISVVALLLRRSRPYLLVGWLWYLGTLVPMIGLVQVGSQARADRYMYLPLIGLSIALAWGSADLLGRWRAGRVALAGAGAAALVALGGTAAVQVTHWRDAVALHSHAVTVTRNNAAEHYRLGNALRMEQRFEEALPYYERAVEIEPRRGGPHIDLANLYLRAGRLEEAIAAYRRGLELKPNHALGHANLGLALLRLERYDEAQPHLERSLELQARIVPRGGPTPTELATPHVALADVLSRQGDLDAAIAHYERALAIDGSRARAGGNLGLALARAGRFEEARPLLEQALAASRYDAKLQAGMAMTFAGLGRQRGAIRHYRNALMLEPGWRLATNDLAWILATSSDPALRDPEQAVRLLEAVRQEEETLPELLDTLAAAYAAAGRFEDAVRTADQALALAQRKPRLAAAIRERRALYRSGRPYLEPPHDAGGDARPQ